MVRRVDSVSRNAPRSSHLDLAYGVVSHSSSWNNADRRKGPQDSVDILRKVREQGVTDAGAKVTEGDLQTVKSARDRRLSRLSGGGGGG